MANSVTPSDQMIMMMMMMTTMTMMMTTMMVSKGTYKLTWAPSQSHYSQSLTLLEMSKRKDSWTNCNGSSLSQP
jgi:hypothetical protein